MNVCSSREGGALIERIGDLIQSRASVHPGDLAAVDGDTRYDNQTLAAAVDAYAKGLIALGVERGDRVAMLTPPSLDFWVALLATVSIGAIWVGLNPRYQKRDFAHLIEDADPKVLIAVSPFEDRDYVSELSPLLKPGVIIVRHDEGGQDVLALAAFLQQGRGVSQQALATARSNVRPTDTAVIVYTSGTTGKPKGAMLSHRTIVLSAFANARWMGREGLARTLCAAPVNHVGAINNICMNVLAGDGAIIFHPRVDLAALARLSVTEKSTYLVASPTAFSMMLENGGGISERLGDTKLIVFGGAATPQSVLEKIAAGPARLSSVYGQTETCGIITYTDEAADVETMAVTIGRPLDGAELRIAGPFGEDLPVGETGEIQIRAPYVMSGYFRNAKATEEAFTSDGFLRTGDLGFQRADGNVVFVGRLKEMFKSGGYNVYPVEIEQAICEHPAVALAAVVSVPHPTFQEVGHAFVQPVHNAAVTSEELKAFLKDRIANYKVPKQFIVEALLPTLPSGKVDKMALKTRATA